MKKLELCAAPENIDLDDDFDILKSVKAFYGIKQASWVYNETFDESCALLAFKCQPSTFI